MEKKYKALIIIVSIVVISVGVLFYIIIDFQNKMFYPPIISPEEQAKLANMQKCFEKTKISCETYEQLPSDWSENTQNMGEGKFISCKELIQELRPNCDSCDECGFLTGDALIESKLEICNKKAVVACKVSERMPLDWNESEYNIKGNLFSCGEITGFDSCEHFQHEDFPQF